MPTTRTDLLVVIGPSGSGKSSVIRHLAAVDLITITPSWTTRRPRPGEQGIGIEHKFVSRSEFDKRTKQGFFLETVTMFGLESKYGLPPVDPPQSGRISLVMLRADLLPLLQRHYKGYLVYQIEDDLNKVKKRLLARQAAGEPMGTRLKDFEAEVTRGRELSDRVFRNNNSINKLVLVVKQAIQEDFKNILS